MSDETIDMGDWEDDDPDWNRDQSPKDESDIVLDVEDSVLYDGSEVGFWEHAEAWGNAVMHGLDGAYNLILTASNMRSTRTPFARSMRTAGDTEFESIIGSLSGCPSAFMMLSGFSKGNADRFPFEVSFSYPIAQVSSYDLPAREWLVRTLGMSTEELRRTTYVSAEEYEFLSRISGDAVDVAQSA